MTQRGFWKCGFGGWLRRAHVLVAVGYTGALCFFAFAFRDLSLAVGAGACVVWVIGAIAFLQGGRVAWVVCVVCAAVIGVPAIRYFAPKAAAVLLEGPFTTTEIGQVAIVQLMNESVLILPVMITMVWLLFNAPWRRRNSGSLGLPR